MSHNITSLHAGRVGVAFAFLVTVLLHVSTSIRATMHPSTTTEVVAKLTRYTVKPAQAAPLRKALSDLVFSSMKAEGNIMSEAYYEQNDSTTLWHIERWSSQQAYDKNQQSVPAKALATLLKQALRTPAEIIDVSDLEPLTKAEWRKTPKKSDQPFTIMLFVDGKAGTEDEFKKRYHVAMPQFRNEAGVVTYQLSQFKSDPTKFITYEKFRNDAAFQFHLKFPPVEPILQYLRTSIKQPPFEKGLHNLIEFAPLIRG